MAPYEADAQLAYLVREKLVDAVVTCDSDLIVFGCDTVGPSIFPSNIPLLTPLLLRCSTRFGTRESVTSTSATACHSACPQQ